MIDRGLSYLAFIISAHAILKMTSLFCHSYDVGFALAFLKFGLYPISQLNKQLLAIFWTQVKFSGIIGPDL